MMENLTIGMVWSSYEKHVLLTSRNQTPSRQYFFATILARYIFDTYYEGRLVRILREYGLEKDDVLEQITDHFLFDSFIQQIIKFLNKKYTYSLLYFIQSYMSDIVIPDISKNDIEDEMFLFYDTREINISTLKYSIFPIVQISENLLKSPRFHTSFSKLVDAYTTQIYHVDYRGKTEIRKHLYEQYYSPMDERLRHLIYKYVSVRVVERAYRCYKLRVLLPVVANKSRLKDEIEYRPLTGIKYFEALSFFENKEFL
jgi:phosphate starvation-inducible membrane PsiE